MSSEGEMRILNLYKGKKLSKAIHALEVAKLYVEQRKVSLRCKIVGLKIGE